jgi:hypothetical protein
MMRSAGSPCLCTDRILIVNQQRLTRMLAEYVQAA